MAQILCGRPTFSEIRIRLDIRPVISGIRLDIWCFPSLKLMILNRNKLFLRYQLSFPIELLVAVRLAAGLSDLSHTNLQCICRINNVELLKILRSRKNIILLCNLLPVFSFCFEIMPIKRNWRFYILNLGKSFKIFVKLKRLFSRIRIHVNI